MNEQINNTKKYLYGHNSKENAYVVEDYPWGFRLRTTIRYWIESKDAKNGGQRFASQTINPKTGVWCAPKYSTYSPIVIMFLDENDHVKFTSLSLYTSEMELHKFKEKHLPNLNEFQKDKLRELLAYQEVMKHVTVEIKPSPLGAVSLLSIDPIQVAKREQLIKESEEREIEQEEVKAKIARAINYRYHKNKAIIV